MSDLCVPAVIRGTAVALVVAIVVGTGARVAELSGAGAITAFVVLLVGVGAGGYIAASRSEASLLVNGAAAGALTFVVAQLVYSLLTASFPHPLGLILVILLFASVGSIGGLVAFQRRQRQSPADGAR